MIQNPKKSSLGILLSYNNTNKLENESVIPFSKHEELKPIINSLPKVGLVGAGNYASNILIPLLRSQGSNLVMVASETGLSGFHVGKKYGFNETTTDISYLIQSEKIDTVIITTRHDSHASLVIQSLEAGKHVFVEKPVCLNLEEIQKLKKLFINYLTSKF